MADVDRISELPESLLHHVLSFLPQKQAIQTSTLSKTWRHVGPTRPKIELRESSFKKYGRPTFLSVLDKTLQRYNHLNLSVQEFIFEMSSSESDDDRNLITDSESTSVLDKHIPILLTNNIGLKKFDLSARHYVLATSLVFRAESLVELCLAECNFVNSNYDTRLNQPLFKGLKKLSLKKVRMHNKTLDKIIRTSPLIEHLSLSACVGYAKTIQLTISQPEFLSELHLTGPKLKIHPTDLLSVKRLKSLFLDKVNISDETLDKIVRSCPLIERVLISNCLELETIQLNNKNNNLKHFTASFNDRVKNPTVEIDGPTVETIWIHNCISWRRHDEYIFPRLKGLCLNRVTLSPEFFESFSSNFPSLEDLELRRCKGFKKKIQLTACSMKRLVLILGSTKRVEANIYAPSIRHFEVFALVPPQLTFYTETETAREWKSRVVMLSNDEVSMLTWLLHLRELLSSLSESRISLDVFPNPFKNLRAEDSSHAGFCKPFIVERVHINGSVRGGNRFSSFTDFLNCLFLVCRPRYLGMSWYVTNRDGPDGDEPKMEKNKLAEYIILKVVGGNQGAMSRGNFWERDLDEISMEVWDDKSRRWHAVRVEGTTFPGSTSTDTRIRFQVKWRD